MIQVHFSGIADWFTKGKNGQSHPRIETVSWIEYDSYQRKYVHITPDNIRFGDNFILTKEDERKYREKEIRHKKHNIDFDKNNLNFVNELQILPDPLHQSELDDIEESGRHYLKIRKYKNFVPNFKDELDYILYPIAFFEETTDTENTHLKLYESDEFKAGSTSEKNERKVEMNTMKALAAMAWLLSMNKSAYKVGDRPNAQAIREAIEPLISAAFPDDTNTFKSFEKKIRAALALFNKDELDFR